MTTDDPRGRAVPHGGPPPHECGDWRIDVEWPALKPCPFCGGHVDESNVDANAGWWVECPTCATFGPFSQSEREAIEAWGRRAARVPRVDGWRVYWRSDPSEPWAEHHGVGVYADEENAKLAEAEYREMGHDTMRRPLVYVEAWERRA